MRGKRTCPAAEHIFGIAAKDERLIRIQLHTTVTALGDRNPRESARRRVGSVQTYTRNSDFCYLNWLRSQRLVMLLQWDARMFVLANGYLMSGLSLAEYLSFSASIYHAAQLELCTLRIRCF